MNKAKTMTTPEALELLKNNGILDNILRHSNLVMKVTEIIMQNLKDSSHINKQLVLNGALLHDITKTRSISTREEHAKTGYEILYNLGYPDIAVIVKEHVFLTDFDFSASLNEIEIVHYADKRVKHDKIVSVKERVDDILKRYGKTAEIKNLILSNTGYLDLLEKKINNNLLKNIEKELLKLNE